MKAVLISIRPKWCEKIASGEKTVEVRKTRPKIKTPFKCFIYCTNGDMLWILRQNERAYHEKIASLFKAKDCGGASKANGNVIGEFVCDRIEDMRDIERDPTCLSIEEWLKYTDGHKGIVYGWHISDLVIYDKPKALGEFQQCHKCPHTCVSQSKSLCEYHRLKRPPQSWCYVEVQE